ncbi:MAG: hypothetical protein ACLGHR_06255 [Gammaproteobacteria bacterium]
MGAIRIRDIDHVVLRVADLERDRALLTRLPALASRLEQEAPAAVQGLIDRWLGRGLAYGEV